MAYVRDLWTIPNPDKHSRKKRVRSSRWGVGKRWQAVWEENGRATTRIFTTEDAAIEFTAQVRVGQALGTWITKDKADVTLGDLWEPWIATKADKAPSTIAGYRSAWAHLDPVWGPVPICEVDAAKLTTWIAGLTSRRVGEKESHPLGSGSKRKVGIVANALLTMAVKQKIIHQNPLESGDLVRQEPGRRRYLRVTEVDALIAAAPTDEARLLVRTMLMTGIRPGEAKGLQVHDLDYYRGRLIIRRAVDALGRPGPTKNRLHRDVPVGGDLLLDLDLAAEGREPDAWLLPDEHGHVWTDARWRRVWAAMCAQAGLEGVDTYTIKHTAVSLAIAGGADVYAVQRMCGHSSASTTLNHYGHLWDEGLDAVPGAIEAHMDRERERERLRVERRSERGSGGRGRLRSV